MKTRPMIVSPSTIRDICGISARTAFRFEKQDDEFPKRVKLSQGRSGWIADELEEYFISRPRIK